MKSEFFVWRMVFTYLRITLKIRKFNILLKLHLVANLFKSAFKNESLRKVTFLQKLVFLKSSVPYKELIHLAWNQKIFGPTRNDGRIIASMF